MVTRHWIVLGAAGLMLSGGSATATVLAAGPGETPVPVTQVHRYYDSGPSAVYSGDAGSIGGVSPTRITTPPDATSYDAVVELSYRALTKGPGPFRLSVTVDTGEADGQDDPSTDDATTQPGRVRIASSDPDGELGVARFLVPDLAPGTTYRITPSVNSVNPDKGRNVVRLSRLLVTAELTAR